MLVKDVIKGYAEGSITRAELAEKLGVTTKTISNKIARLGYTWDKSAQKHLFMLEDEKQAEIENMDFYEYVRGTQTIKASKPSEAKNGLVRASKDSTPNKPQSIESKPVKAETSLNDDLKAIGAMFDVQEEKVYKGFYLDADIANVIDRVGSRSKSKVVNEALRVVFKANNLL